MSGEVRRDRKRYENLKKFAREELSSERYDSALYFAYQAASLGWHCTFRWKDGELEEIIERVGREGLRDSSLEQSGDRESGENIAYVVSVLSDQGGGAESIYQCTSLLSGREDIGRQEVFVTNSRGEYSEYPRLKQRFSNIGVNIQEYSPEDSCFQRARKLQGDLEGSDVDRIALVIDPNDVVAIAALTGMEVRPSTLYYNLNDHVYWIGRNVIDDLIDARPEGAIISEKYRGKSVSSILPLATDISPTNETPDALDFDGDPAISITVGSSHKISDFEGPRYGDIVNRILEQTDNHHHVLITTGDFSPGDFLPSTTHEDRFHVLGPVADPTPYYSAADVLIDTVPFGGSLTRLEAMACRTAVAAFVNPRYPFLGNNDTLPQTYEYVARTTDQMVTNSVALIQDEERRNQAIAEGYERYQNAFHPDAVRDRWAKVVRGDEVEFLPESHRPVADSIQRGETYGDLAEMDFDRYIETTLRYCLGEIELDDPYEMEGFAEYFNRPFHVSKPILKEYHRGRFADSLPFSTRVSTYLDAQKNEEFTSRDESSKFLLLSLIGRSRYFRLKSLLKR